MSHELETKDGLATVALRGGPAWHRLAEPIPYDEDITIDEFLKRAHMTDWNVRLQPVSELLTQYASFAKEQYLVLRNNPFTPTDVDVLGIVGKIYTTFQNEQIGQFGQNLSEYEVETAGSMLGGTKVFVSFKAPKTLVLDPNGVADKIERYLLLSSSHDGSSSLTAHFTDVRVVCWNTWTAAMKGASNTYKIRHTSSMDGRVEEARKVLGIAHARDELFEAEAEKMIQTQVTRDKFTDIVAALYPAPAKDASKNAVTRYANLIEKIDEVYTSPTQDGIRTTAWGAANALSERLDYFGQNRENSEGQIMAAAGFSDIRNAERQRIFDTVRALTLT